MFMYWKFKSGEDRLFTKTKDILKPLPTAFRKKAFQNVRVVIDCCEIQIENSSNYMEQGHTYSCYKHYNTGKVLIGVSPHGAAIFVSQVFEGSISDTQICRKSHFYNYIEPKDKIMGDRGFKDIREDLKKMDAELVVPPSVSNDGFLNILEEYRTRSIAAARIHIERYV